MLDAVIVWMVGMESVQNRDPKELAKRLGLYADGITAFVLIQSLAFLFSLLNSNVLATLIKLPWQVIWMFWVIIHFLQIILVLSCQRGEDALLGKPVSDTAVEKWTQIVRFGRVIIIIAADIVMSVVILIAGFHNRNS